MCTTGGVVETVPGCEGLKRGLDEPWAEIDSIPDGEAPA
jgi:hypothetical protein